MHRHICLPARLSILGMIILKLWIISSFSWSTESIRILPSFYRWQQPGLPQCVKQHFSWFELRMRETSPKTICLSLRLLIMWKIWHISTLLNPTHWMKWQWVHIHYLFWLRKIYVSVKTYQLSFHVLFFCALHLKISSFFQ